MSRWDYDTVLYRVFCITLLGVAFTFTVILTNVFVDIDGLLAKKDKAQPPKPSSPISHDLSELSRVINVKMAAEDKSEDVYEDKDYQDSNDLYRSKRSLESPDRFFHIKDPKVKKLLTNHLANLLDELDERDSKNNKGTNKNNVDKKHGTKIQNLNKKTEDSSTENKNNFKEPVVSINEYFKYNTDDFRIDSKKRDKEDTKEENIKLFNELGNKNTKTMNSQKDYKAELLHLAMHNVILQGIIENTNLDDVYKKVADVVKQFEKDHAEPNLDELTNIFKNVKHGKKSVEYSNRKTLLEELTSGKEPVRKEYDSISKNINDHNETMVENNTIQGTTTGKPKDHNVIIKTLIDITAMSNDKTNKGNEQDTKDKINGIIKLIYNGNVIKFKRMEDENNTTTQSYTNKLDQNNTVHTNNDSSNQTYYKKTIYDYLQKFNADSAEQEKVISKKRLKRHIKIKYDNKKSSTKSKNKKDDDELFVEIETHFDSKGLKGEKKKKMIKELIGKIQNALHSDHNEHKKKQKHWHVKKRVQDPLSSKTAAALINKLILPLETLAHRHLDPISKNIVLREELPVMTNMFDRKKWEKPYYSPSFFAKAINSAEANTVDTDYNKVMKHNGIPQRLQKPLNTEMSDDVFEDSKIVDLGNIKFLMKDIGGTGFSIGFNQYTDEAPDTETMKLFSGLENIIQTYHQQYDQESPPNPQEQNTFNGKNNIVDDTNNEEELVHKYDEHVVQRRSILTSDENDHHPNNYRILYGHNLPYKNYDDIFYPEKSKNSKIKNTKLYRKKNAKSSFVIDEHVFEKDLRPAEILSIANFLQRKKRSMKVKKISSVKLKSNINRYINTHNMASKSVFMNKKSAKRTKRQIDKIRIIARDLPQNVRSDEDNIFVVSDEKIFADRALVREVDVPEIESDDKARSVEHYDIITPQKEEEFFDIDSQSQKMNEEPEDNGDVLTPYIFDVSPFEVHNEFSRRARHNSLMSKYPHIIMDETPSYVNRGEQFLVDNIQQAQLNIESTTTPPVPTIIDIPSPNEQEITELISPPKDHSNYRVSVKIRPKNSTNMSGYKEVHTSINKSYNKNGLTYTSLVNVSQLSKVEKLNKTVTRRENDEQTEQKGNLKQQHDLIKALIQQHKRRLDTQLKHLQSEKQKLENIYKENLENTSNKPVAKVKKLRKSLQEDAKKKRIRESTTEEVTTEPPTELTTEFIPEYIQTTTEDMLKYKMLETIERNENITNELLKKIDQNTGVLKIFLGKLIATIDVPSRRSTEMAPKAEDSRKEVTDNSKGVVSIATTPPNRNPQNNQLPLNFEDYHYMPNVLFRHLPKQVNSSYGIPFVYAVQQPYGIVPNRDNMASVVYHGHIHTSTMNDNVKRDTNPIKVVLQDKIKVVTDKKNTDAEFWKPKPGEKVIQDFFVSKNNTRFFLDDARNEFTAVPFSDAKKIFPPGIANSTKV